MSHRRDGVLHTRPRLQDELQGEGEIIFERGLGGTGVHRSERLLARGCLEQAPWVSTGSTVALNSITDATVT
jgi:hypothetical protein